MSDADDKIDIENFTSPNWRGRVDRQKYLAMRDALLPVLPKSPPGLTIAQAKAALLKRLSEVAFPNGEKAGWWLKAVQLDLEAKGIIARDTKTPVRIFRCK